MTHIDRLSFSQYEGVITSIVIASRRHHEHAVSGKGHLQLEVRLQYSTDAPHIVVAKTQEVATGFAGISEPLVLTEMPRDQLTATALTAALKEIQRAKSLCESIEQVALQLTPTLHQNASERVDFFLVSTQRTPLELVIAEHITQWSQIINAKVSSIMASYRQQSFFIEA